MHKEDIKIVAISILLFILLIVIVFGTLWSFKTFKVWSAGQDGKAELAQAEYNRRIAVEEAQANLEAEKLNALAEVERAKGAAEAIRIEGGSLTDNYIKYLWVRQLATGEKQLIYIPTEAGLPILEAGRF